MGGEHVAQVAPEALFIAQFELAVTLLGSGVSKVLPTNIGSSIDLDGLTVSAVSAAHSSSIQNPDTGQHEYRGTAMGSVLELENGYKIYAAGDTGLTADMKFVVADFFKPDLAILPCDGLLNMSPKQAAYAARVLGVSHVIPSHDFPNTDVAPGMAGMIEGYPFVAHMVDKRNALAHALADDDINVIVLNHGDAHPL